MSDKFGLKKFIRKVNDFPIEGIVFRDITSLIETPEAFVNTCEQLTRLTKSFNANAIASIESRGFIFAGSIAKDLSLPFILARKPGKLPGKIISQSYDTEYSSDKLSLQIGTGSVVIVDDVLATGGTLATVDKLCFSAGYNVQNHLVLIDLKYVPRSNYYLETKIKTLKSLISYE